MQIMYFWSGVQSDLTWYDYAVKYVGVMQVKIKHKVLLSNRGWGYSCAFAFHVLKFALTCIDDLRSEGVFPTWVPHRSHVIEILQFCETDDRLVIQVQNPKMIKRILRD